MEDEALSTRLKSHFKDVSFGKDRISELPDEILYDILFFLPPTDIGRTSALSTRWRSLWTFFLQEDATAKLSFWYNNFPIRPKNRVLRGYFDIFFKTQPLKRIILGEIQLTGPIDDVSVDLWTDKLRKKLHLYIQSQTLFWMSDNSSAFLSLTSLELRSYCTLIVPDSMCFPRLKALKIGQVKFQDDHSLQQLLSGCRVLEELSLESCRWTHVNNISISLPILQKRSCASKDVLLNLPSLTDAQLYVNNCEPHSALTLLSGVLGVKSLRLSIEAISSVENLLAHLPTFHNLTHLEVFGRFRNCVKRALVCILQKSANLHALEVKQTPNPCNDEDRMFNRGSENFKCSIKNFRISNFAGSEGEIHFLKYVLENVIRLEKMSISWSSIIPINIMEMHEDVLSKQLGQLSRGSTSRVIKFDRP